MQSSQSTVDFYNLALTLYFVLYIKHSTQAKKPSYKLFFSLQMKQQPK